MMRPVQNQQQALEQNLPMIEMPQTNREETNQPILIQNERKFLVIEQTQFHFEKRKW